MDPNQVLQYNLDTAGSGSGLVLRRSDQFQIVESSMFSCRVDILFAIVSPYQYKKSSEISQSRKSGGGRLEKSHPPCPPYEYCVNKSNSALSYVIGVRKGGRLIFFQKSKQDGSIQLWKFGVWGWEGNQCPSISRVYRVG